MRLILRCSVAAMWLITMFAQAAEVVMDCEPPHPSDGAREKEWGRQKRDPAWSTEAERKIREAVDRARLEVGPESEALGAISVECRTTLCRMDFQDTDDATLGTFLAALPWHLQWVGGMQLQSSANSTVALYLLRSRAPVIRTAVSTQYVSTKHQQR